MLERRAVCAERRTAVRGGETGKSFGYDVLLTLLPTAIKGAFLYQYLLMGVYSRTIIAWPVYEQESGEWAAEIPRDIAQGEGMDHNQVALHPDNGGPMKGTSMLALGVIPSFCRPAVSNDKPY